MNCIYRDEKVIFSFILAFLGFDLDFEYNGAILFLLDTAPLMCWKVTSLPSGVGLLFNIVHALGY